MLSSAQDFSFGVPMRRRNVLLFNSEIAEKPLWQDMLKARFPGKADSTEYAGPLFHANYQTKVLVCSRWRLGWAPIEG